MEAVGRKSNMKKNVTVVLSIFATLLAFSVTEGLAQDKLRETLRRMDKHNKGLTTLRANITIVKENTQLKDEPDVRIGTVIYAKPKKDALIRIDWQKPQESISSMDGKYVLFQPRNKVALTGVVNNVKYDGGNTIFAFLKMSKEQLNAGYSAQYVGQATLSDGTQTVQLRLTPKTKASYSSAELWIDVDGMLRQAKMVESNSTTTLLLSGIKTNQKMDKSEFRINLPKGTEIKPT
jgi:outer membrane lipoprotein-sorting protein